MNDYYIFCKDKISLHKYKCIKNLIIYFLNYLLTNIVSSYKLIYS